MLSNQNFLPASVSLLRYPSVQDNGEIAAMMEHLTGPERQRMSQFIAEQDGLRWGWMRGKLREILGNWLNQPPGEVVMETTPHGKPYLPNERGREFNLSHAGDWMLVGLNENGAIGVDLEIPRPKFPYLELAEDYFTNQERDSVHQKPETEQIQQFLKIWTSKEALCKAIGLGLSIAPASVELRLDSSGHPVGFLLLGELSTAAKDWRLQCVTEGELVAAVVTEVH